MYDKAQFSFPRDVARIQFIEAVANLVQCGLTASEIQAEYNSAMDRLFTPSQIPKSTGVLKAAILHTYPKMGAGE